MFSHNLSKRIESVEPSKTVAFTSLIQEMRKQGKEIINFAVGEPEFETPEEIINATKHALDNGETRYGQVTGIPELRKKLAEQFTGYDSDNIIISNGSKQSLYTAFQVICNPGDEVIIPNPYWVSFSQQVRLAGAAPVMVPSLNNRLDCNAISKSINKNTCAILINTPNNPTGAVYPKSDSKKIVNLAKEHNLYLISDEAYEFFTYDKVKHESLYNFKEIHDRLIITKSFSKSFSMTGFRIGYVAGPKPIIKAMAKLQSHCSGNVCTFAQHGALAALSLDNNILKKWQKELNKKRDIAFDFTSKLFKCIKPQGAFYLFPDISKYLKDGETSEDFSSKLLTETGVAVVPGEAFGQEGHVRISYAVPEKILIKGFEKISKYLK